MRYLFRYRPGTKGSSGGFRIFGGNNHRRASWSAINAVELNEYAVTDDFETSLIADDKMTI